MWLWAVVRPSKCWDKFVGATWPNQNFPDLLMLGKAGLNSNMAPENVYRNHCRSFVLHWTFVIWELPSYVDKIKPQTISTTELRGKMLEKGSREDICKEWRKIHEKKQQAHRDQAAPLGLYAQNWQCCGSNTTHPRLWLSFTPSRTISFEAR